MQLSGGRRPHLADGRRETSRGLGALGTPQPPTATAAREPPGPCSPRKAPLHSPQGGAAALGGGEGRRRWGAGREPSLTRSVCSVLVRTHHVTLLAGQRFFVASCFAALCWGSEFFYTAK